MRSRLKAWYHIQKSQGFDRLIQIAERSLGLVSTERTSLWKREDYINESMMESKFPLGHRTKAKK